MECNETWQPIRLIDYLFSGVYFIPYDCYCDVIYDVQIWHSKDQLKKNVITMSTNLSLRYSQVLLVSGYLV